LYGDVDSADELFEEAIVEEIDESALDAPALPVTSKKSLHF
jgi:hypothetical protein